MVAVILAAGLGTRMRSRVPKVLHLLGGRPLLDWPIALARRAGAGRIIVVIGRGSDAMRAYLGEAHADVETTTQAEPRGSGDAARTAARRIGRDPRPVLILCGDVPLVRAATIARLRAARRRAPLAIVTCRPEDPRGYGRIVREGSRAVRVVEEKDATAAERRIGEANSGIYLADGRWLLEALRRLRPSKGGEVYLTDLVGIAARQGRVVTIEADADETIGVNDRADLARAEALLRARTVDALLRAGVTVRDPATTFVDPTVRIGADTELHPGVHIRGVTVIGGRCVIETGCVIADSRIEDDTHVLAHSVVRESRIGKGARVGPFAHLRPGSELGAGVHVGNFVETKKAHLGKGAKANHHAYLGDAQIGARSNIGAGTITCNYDGLTKHPTVIEDDVFVGSDTQLIAPVRVGRGAYIGAGSTITRDVPAGALALTRTPQKVVPGWAARRIHKRR
jgi:bifunctional UDP-N-acetylglucosamine pyrophosphorylase / glucosamine-1-phosphate N-acetyltransferase